MSELAGRVALVTGASRGIGAEIARELARGGARVVVGFRSQREAAEAVVAEIAAAGGEAWAVQGDVATAPGCRALVDAALAQGGPHVLVNNAGITDDRLTLQMTDEQFTRVLDTNTTGTFRMSRMALEHMFRSRDPLGSAIVNVVSVSGLKGNRGQANYAASKAAVLAMTRVMAQEMGRRKVRVNAVAPGFVETDMVADVDPRVTEEALRMIPLRRLGHPTDVAPAVRFLAGPGAAWITGQCLVIDGGMTA
ncbi:MAG: 3-oxoacyl-ACP reductase family protein [Myxococcota bacterium]